MTSHATGQKGATEIKTTSTHKKIKINKFYNVQDSQSYTRQYDFVDLRYNQIVLVNEHTQNIDGHTSHAQPVLLFSKHFTVLVLK